MTSIRDQTIAAAPSPSRTWTLWAVAASAALHATEEYFTGWQAWAPHALGILVPDWLFVTANAVLVLLAFRFASFGWRRPRISLVIPSATLINAVFLHMLPTLWQGRVAPGLYTAMLLYLPFSSYALVGAKRDGVAPADIARGFAGGAALMGGVLLGARAISPPG